MSRLKLQSTRMLLLPLLRVPRLGRLSAALLRLLLLPLPPVTVLATAADEDEAGRVPRPESGVELGVAAWGCMDELGEDAEAAAAPEEEEEDATRAA